ncbi:MAG: tetratricopeptide repeat protein [Verrucomicrobiae bacterium]|nr:tetratricopeptide repeat protein [Verrucomicrobiae bacterium]
MPLPRTPLDLELRFSGIRREAAEGGDLRPAFDVHVVDHSLASPAGMVMSLALPKDVPLGGDRTGTFEEAQARFAQNAWSEGEALDFGRWLADWLFPTREAEIRRTWENLRCRALREHRPLRLFLTFPGDLDLSFDPASVPFELLASDGAFAFRAGGSSVVRTFTDLEAESWSWEPGTKLGTVWANTVASSGLPLPAAVFEAHCAAVRDGATALGGTALDPCSRASLPALRAYFAEHSPIDVVACIAHGQRGGGRVWLHDPGNRSDPNDSGEPVSAGDFAAAFRSARVRVAFLWICHGGERNRELDGLSAQLLKNGRVVAVVAAHVPVDAERSVTLARAIFDAARKTARSLEEAVSDARRSLHSSDLQWAAPVYYARPLRGESISFEQRLRQSFEEILEREKDRAFVLSAPDPVPYFRGREADLAELIRRMTAHRLVTLTGLPGIGKSELARAAVARLESGGLLVERAVWLSLQSLTSVNAIVARVASELFPESRDLEGPSALFRAMGKLRVLWILDNAEDLIAADPHRLRQFLAQAFAAVPGLRCLLASRRESGDLDGVTENVLDVDVLPAGHAREVFLAIAGPRLDDDEVRSPDLEELLKLLDGHPRSIVLVAGQAGRSFPIRSLLRRVREHRVDAVEAYQMLGEAAPGTLDERRLQRSQRLVASLDLAYDALSSASSQAADVFRWLSVFPAGLPSALALPIFGEEAAEAVALLRRHSMIQVVGGDRRLRLPAPLQWYAHREWSRHQDPQRDARLIAAAEALARWLVGHHSANLGVPRRTGIALRTAGEDGQNLNALFIQFAGLNTAMACRAWLAADSAIEAWATIELFAGRAQAALDAVQRWLQWSGIRLPAAIRSMGDLEAEGDQLQEAEVSYREALRICRQTEARLDEANTLQALGNLLMRRSRLQEAEQTYLDALAIHQQIGNPMGVANALHALGDLEVRRAQFQKATSNYRQSLIVFRQIGESLGEANTLRGLGDLQARRARLDEAESNYRKALIIFRDIDYSIGEGNTLKALGDLLVRRDRLQEAEQTYLDALTIFRQMEFRLGEANTLQALGDLQVRGDRLKDAEQSYREALPIFRQIEARLGEANTLRALGDLQARKARPWEAELSYREALPIFRQFEDRLGEANTLKVLGDLHAHRDLIEQSERSYCEALPIYRQVEDRLGEANTLRALGALQLRDDRLEEAEQNLREALPIYRQIEARLGEANTLRTLGDLQARRARLQEAEQHYHDALAIYRQIAARLGEANTLQALGDLQVRRDRLQDAEQSYREALPIYRQIEDRLGEANTLLGIAKLTLRQGNPGSAFNRYREALAIQAAIESRLGMAGSLGYLARAAAAAGEIDRAIVLGAWAWKGLADLEDAFGQGLALRDLARALAMKDPQSAVAALYLSWTKAKSIDDPSAGERGRILANEIPDFDPENPNPMLVEECEALVANAAAASLQALQDRGIDPLSPMDETMGPVAPL